MIKRYCYLFMLVIVSLIVHGCERDERANTHVAHHGKKVLYIDSYHAGYTWSDSVTQGIRQVFDPTSVELRIHRMDTKRNASEQFKTQAAVEAHRLIQAWQPDVVIASDDNAFKYLIQPYYKDADLPFVFCGINWDVTESYGGPYKNTTGMVEVSLLNRAIDAVKPHANGERIGFISSRRLTERKDAVFYEQHLGLELAETRFVRDFDQWKEQFVELQGRVDILIVGVTAGIEGWNMSAAKRFVHEQAKIPTLANHVWMVEEGLGMLAFGKVAEEQGKWSALAALRILDGAKPASIAVVRNKSARVALNMNLAARLRIAFCPELIRQAVVVVDDHVDEVFTVNSPVTQADANE